MPNNADIHRRQLLKGACAVAIGSSLPARRLHASDRDTQCNFDDAVEEIKTRLLPPSFPDQHYTITQFGAVGDATKLCTDAINNAIAACHEAGGGRVMIPAGIYRTGAIRLLSNVELHLKPGSELRFSQATEDYLPMVQTWFEGVELMNYQPHIFALNARNIAITGQGLLNGGATFDGWWSWRGPRSWKGAISGTSTGWQPGMPYQKTARNQLMQMAADDVPVNQRRFGDGHYLRSSMVEFNRCSNVLIEGVTIKDAPFWSVHPVLCRNVIAKSVTIHNPVGANADGIDPECCEDVWIDNCYFNNGDDCISIKSGRNHDGRRINTPSRNIIISDCHFESERSAISCGSESSGGIENVYVSNVVADKVFRLFRIKTNDQRGGYTHNIHLHSIKVHHALENLIEVQANFGEPLKDDPLELAAKQKHFPSIRGIHIHKLQCKKTQRALNIVGTQKTPVKALSLNSIQVNSAQKPNIVLWAPNAIATDTNINGTPLKLK
ncbi:glycoside hydrolase [Arenicella chitinivorans]|uniref:Glycoside hydrolase n=1 Tax=Arenicella chitinivorans TaxID=1329800 RepID=A0A918RG43_9GAMM|nr:glycoside hydrolase family 28 protein [Arenicella chitinivorans]GGZ97621.1 glycoside hydrolase [Arenicella chitinivorans]